jgi:hypothetical protein
VKAFKTLYHSVCLKYFNNIPINIVKSKNLEIMEIFAGLKNICEIYLYLIIIIIIIIISFNSPLSNVL